MTSYDIKEYNLVKQYKITRFDIRVIELLLNQSVTLMVTLFEGDRPVDVKNIKLENNDYAQWGSDDQYLVNKVVEILGLERPL